MRRDLDARVHREDALFRPIQAGLDVCPTLARHCIQLDALMRQRPSMRGAAARGAVHARSTRRVALAGETEQTLQGGESEGDETLETRNARDEDGHRHLHTGPVEWVHQRPYPRTLDACQSKVDGPGGGAHLHVWSSEKLLI